MSEIPGWAVAVITGAVSFAATWGAIRTQVASVTRKLDELAAEVKEVRHIMTQIEVVDARLRIVEKEVSDLRQSQHHLARDVGDLRAACNHSHRERS